MGNARTRRPDPLGTATVMIGLWWDDRWKRWHCRVEHRNGTVAMRSFDTTTDIGQPETWLLLGAVENEVLSWLSA